MAAAPRPTSSRTTVERPEPRHKPARHPAPAAAEPSALTLANAAASPVQAATAPPAPTRSAPDPTWQSALAAWLAAHKHYPEEARANNQQGAVGVAFTVARDGRVELVRIDRSSGVPVLDRSVVAMLENRRVPPFSPAMTGDQAAVRVTIRFELDR